MFIQLAHDENYRGVDCKKGDIIEVGGALGDMLVLNGHIKVAGLNVEPTEEDSDDKDILSDEQIDALSDEEISALVKKHEIQSQDNKKKTILQSLKNYYASLKGE